MNYLVDSSVWIEYFMGNQKVSFLDELIKFNAICTNDIVLTELLPPIIHKNEHKLAELLNAVRKYALNIDWFEIRNIQLLNLKNGNNKVGISDIVIAQNCIQNELILLSFDKHFRIMANYIPLKLFE